MRRGSQRINRNLARDILKDIVLGCVTISQLLIKRNFIFLSDQDLIGSDG